MILSRTLPGTSLRYFEDDDLANSVATSTTMDPARVGARFPVRTMTDFETALAERLGRGAVFIPTPMLETTESLEPGTRLELRLQMADGDVVMTLTGVVAWCYEDGSVPAGREAGIGFAFERPVDVGTRGLVTRLSKHPRFGTRMRQPGQRIAERLGLPLNPLIRIGAAPGLVAPTSRGPELMGPTATPRSSVSPSPSVARPSPLPSSSAEATRVGPTASKEDAGAAAVRAALLEDDASPPLRAPALAPAISPAFGGSASGAQPRGVLDAAAAAVEAALLEDEETLAQPLAAPTLRPGHDTADAVMDKTGGGSRTTTAPGPAVLHSAVLHSAVEPGPREERVRIESPPPADEHPDERDEERDDEGPGDIDQEIDAQEDPDDDAITQGSLPAATLGPDPLTGTEAIGSSSGSSSGSIEDAPVVTMRATPPGPPSPPSPPSPLSPSSSGDDDTFLSRETLVERRVGQSVERADMEALDEETPSTLGQPGSPVPPPSPNAAAGDSRTGLGPRPRLVGLLADRAATDSLPEGAATDDVDSPSPRAESAEAQDGQGDDALSGSAALEQRRRELERALLGIGEDDDAEGNDVSLDMPTLDGDSGESHSVSTPTQEHLEDPPAGESFGARGSPSPLGDRKELEPNTSVSDDDEGATRPTLPAPKHKQAALNKGPRAEVAPGAPFPSGLFASPSRSAQASSLASSSSEAEDEEETDFARPRLSSTVELSGVEAFPEAPPPSYDVDDERPFEARSTDVDLFASISAADVVPLGSSFEGPALSDAPGVEGSLAASTDEGVGTPNVVSPTTRVMGGPSSLDDLPSVEAELVEDFESLHSDAPQRDVDGLSGHDAGVDGAADDAADGAADGPSQETGAASNLRSDLRSGRSSAAPSFGAPSFAAPSPTTVGPSPLDASGLELDDAEADPALWDVRTAHTANEIDPEESSWPSLELAADGLALSRALPMPEAWPVWSSLVDARTMGVAFTVAKRGNSVGIERFTWPEEGSKRYSGIGQGTMVVPAEEDVFSSADRDDDEDLFGNSGDGPPAEDPFASQGTDPRLNVEGLVARNVRASHKDAVEAFDDDAWALGAPMAPTNVGSLSSMLADDADVTNDELQLPRLATETPLLGQRRPPSGVTAASTEIGPAPEIDADSSSESSDESSKGDAHQ